ncbi:hypothetical protein JOB18_041395 [Solea senegalensis]|uniref:Uncharacterized protein n=1 Tax=Solea senegalensis TaxID=28829 RepID=A0AAV6RFQ9_SOLSE|nr:hypothetical protein JOB18_041395 [Solea senegalensis]
MAVDIFGRHRHLRSTSEQTLRLKTILACATQQPRQESTSHLKLQQRRLRKGRRAFRAEHEGIKRHFLVENPGFCVEVEEFDS